MREYRDSKKKKGDKTGMIVKPRPGEDDSFYIDDTYVKTTHCNLQQSKPEESKSLEYAGMPTVTDLSVMSLRLLDLLAP